VGNEMGIRGRTWCHCVCVIGLSESRGLGEEFGGSCNTREKHVNFWETNLCMKVEARSVELSFIGPLIVALSLIHGSHFGLDWVEIIMIYWNLH
jgi:hypothetical protein